MPARQRPHGPIGVGEGPRHSTLEKERLAETGRRPPETGGHVRFRPEASSFAIERIKSSSGIRIRLKSRSPRHRSSPRPGKRWSYSCSNEIWMFAGGHIVVKARRETGVPRVLWLRCLEP